MKNILILGGFLVVDSHSIYKSWGVLIQGNRIQVIAENSTLKANYSGEKIIDATDKILAPGFVNAHHHAYGILAHGISIGQVPAGFRAFLEDFWWPRVENRLDHEMITAATAQSCYEMINSGITSFCDILEAPNALPGVLHAEAEVVRQSGLRAKLCIEASERISTENGNKCLQENAGFIKSAAGQDELINGMMCTHTSFTCTQEFLHQALEMSRALDTSLHLHLSESQYEPLASQLVAVEQSEIDVLSRNKVRGVHMPLSNCEVGGGISPVPQILAGGLSMGLGTDGYINNFFEVMRGTFLIHKASNRDTNVMPADKVFEMATQGGADALGFSKTGRLDAGYSADLIAIDGNFPTPVTEENVLDQLILYRNPSEVSLVMVDGKILKENGIVLSLDKDTVREKSRIAAQKLWQENRL
jgi:cytosine/adenosine deaminase-related metal-dependent hydrolase